MRDSPTTARLRTRNLSFTYGSRLHILDDCNLSFWPGEVVALTGESGRGKSTLLYLLGLMLSPTSGDIEVDGTDTVGLSDRERSGLRARRFGFVFQDAALDTSRTVLDNVLETVLYRNESRRDAQQRAIELLERFHVSIRADHRPGQISGGQAQRIAVCRALLARPDIVLADEPTGNLDAGSSQIVISALREHAESGATIVIATHDRDVQEACDRVVAL
ncbi:ABC transporter ATP-binding protein [Agrococcus casei]|uniref:ABC transporter ATP-binding protein n=1 Tax=Agrococcus casei TaxID=343512 RepID=UPI003F91DA78